MKKFTLLAAMAMIAGSAIAQTEAPAELNGIKLSNDKNDTTYYRVRNMRAMRLDYNTGIVSDINGDSINIDNACIKNTPYLQNEADSTLTDEPTPRIPDNPYMGLSSLNGNWWLSFSNQKDVKDPDTEFWYFEWGGSRAPKTVKIHNAVINGTVADTSKSVMDQAGYRRNNMDFNTKANNRYYVLPVKEAFEKMYDETGEDWVDSINKSLKPGDLELAFTFCQNDSIGKANNDALDMNNYVNYKFNNVRFDENGDTVKNDNGYVQYNCYGFAGVDRTWSSIRKNGSNLNHWVNNGTLFFVAEANKAEAEAARDRYADKIKEEFRKGAVESARGTFAGAQNTIKGWLNVPAIWDPAIQDQLRTILNYCENWNGEGTDPESVVDPDTRDAYAEIVQNLANSKIAEAAALVGKGCQVRFQNQLALRDLESFLGGEVDEDKQLGLAYLTAGGSVTFRESNGHVSEYADDEEYLDKGIVPMLDESPENIWELVPVPGTSKFYLYNPETKYYIRKYHDMYSWLGGEEYLGAGVSEISWGATANLAEAAPFNIIACPNADDQAAITDEENELLGSAGLDTGIENKVRLEAEYQINTGTLEVPVYETYTKGIHRGSTSSDYKFIGWQNTYNNWFADTNAFLVEPVKKGGISEVSAEKAAKATGIYDLQGRRVVKATKGVYIINGVKTFVR